MYLADGQGEAVRGAHALLLPGDESPGPDVLSGSQRLFHARARPEGGLDFASLVPEGSQADRMFLLKSELFAGAVLDGTWEAAIYLPEDGEPTPRAALALGFTHRRLRGDLLEPAPGRDQYFKIFTIRGEGQLAAERRHGFGGVAWPGAPSFAKRRAGH